jgi:DNA (cytosine-5)-methyltransferase 1
MTLKSSKLRSVSLFTGAGGLDLGCEAAGFETCVAVDFDPNCCATLRTNRPWPVLEKDIHQVSSREILDAGGTRRGEVDLLTGGPPCQPFSKSAFWASGDTRRLDDPRASTLSAYMRVVSDLLPKVFLLENVHGIAYSGKEEGFRLLAQIAEEINRRHGTDYQLSWGVVNAADYGVPQMRRRFVLVGHRDGKPFQFPGPTHHDPEAGGGFQSSLFPAGQPYVAAWDAIGGRDLIAPGEDLRVRGRWADLLSSIPEGQNYLWHTARRGGLPLFGWRRCYWSFLLKLAKAQPSWTIQAQPGPAIGPFHWENRLLSTEEMARLQTFPTGLAIPGGRTSAQRQLGNAVPSLLAEVLAREIAYQFFSVPLPEQYTFTVGLRRPIPPPEPVKPVAAKYLPLQGVHAEHPGTGKGYAASLRETKGGSAPPHKPRADSHAGTSR